MTTLDPTTLDGLRPAERERLERFAALFDRIDAKSYITLTEATERDGVTEAQERALEHMGSGRRRDAIRAAARAFIDAATVAYARRTPMTDILFMFNSLPDRAEDRVRFLASVERAVVALILWDELDDPDRVALLGPWAPSVIPLIEPEA